MAQGKGRGFASMVSTQKGKMKQALIAGKGGRAAHAKGVAHTWTSEEARIAGRKGGRAKQGKE